jgi:hypothetical protein
MTEFRIASLLVAVVAGAYAALMLIDCQLVDFRRRRSCLCGILGRSRGDRLRGEATRQGGGAGDEWPAGRAVTSRRLSAPTNIAHYVEVRAKRSIPQSDSSTGRARGMRTRPQPRADSMSLRPVSVPVLMGEQRERVSRWTAGPGLGVT